jgi:hypothetical protein
MRRIVPNAVADSTLPPMDNRKRWDAQIRDGRVRLSLHCRGEARIMHAVGMDGKLDESEDYVIHVHTQVRNIGAADVAAMINDGWTILDVRPPTETSKAAIKGAVAVSASCMV